MVMQTKSLNIGFVTLWFERGQAHVSKTLQEALASYHNIFVFARAGYCWGKKMVPEKTGYWDIPNLTCWNANKISKRALIEWIEENRLDAVIFNEEGDWGLVKACSQRTTAINYLDSYYSAWAKKMGLFDGILCSTRRTFQMLKDIAPSYFISWGLDSTLFKPLLESEQKDFTFFHNAGWGGVGYRKMTPYVVRAFDEISKINPSLSLLVHSQAELKKYPGETRKIIKRNQRISFIQKTIPAPGLYHKGKIYVYPTKLEGLGLTILEALACGLPVITTDAPPMNEFVRDGHNGLLVRVGERKTRYDGIAFPETIVEFDDLKEKMLKLSSDRDLIGELSAGARADILENYNSGQFRERCNRAIREIHEKGMSRLSAKPNFSFHSGKP
jgi:1,2-diacylglycerol 3-alpha-glucosyltransferase